MKAIGKALVVATALFFVAPGIAAALVNINTASLSELDTLPGVGPATAQKIIDARPYATKEEISKADGIGEPGAPSYDNIIDLIVVAGDSAPQDTDEEEETTTASSTSSSGTSSSSSSKEKAPLKAATIAVDGAAVAGAPTRLAAVVTDAKGVAVTYGVRYEWNFGDGTVGSLASETHIYQYPGTYTVRLVAKYNNLEEIAEHSLVVLASGVSLMVPGDGSVALKNIAGDVLDIGGWILMDNGVLFTIPSGTRLAKGAEARFAHSVTGIAGSINTVLLFPAGTLAASTAPPKPTDSGYGDLPAGKSPEVLSPSLQKPPPSVVSAPLATAAVANMPFTQATLPWVALAGVVVVGSAGTYWYGRKSVVTNTEAGEFDIL